MNKELKERFDRKLDYLYQNEHELAKMYRDNYIVHQVITRIYIIDDQSLEAAKTEIIKILLDQDKKRVNQMIEKILTSPIINPIIGSFKP